MTGAVRVLLAKSGLDGHDRGLKVVAMALRDAGAEVVYLGLRRTPDQIVSTARDESVDCIGVSALSGTHLPLARRLLERRRALGLGDVPVVMGGTIPAAHVAALRAAGVAAVYPVGSAIDDVVAGVLRLARKEPVS